MTNWDKLSDKEKKAKYADMAMSYLSFMNEEDLAKFNEDEANKPEES